MGTGNVEDMMSGGRGPIMSRARCSSFLCTFRFAKFPPGTQFCENDCLIEIIGTLRSAARLSLLARAHPYLTFNFSLLILTSWCNLCTFMPKRA